MSDGGGDPRGDLERRLAKAERRLGEAEAERDEAREREAATAEILKIIASSPSDTQPVFDAIATSAKRLLGGLTGAVNRYEGEWTHLAALTPLEPAADAATRAAFPMRLPPADSPIAEQMHEHGFVEVVDTEAQWFQSYAGPSRARGFRSLLLVQLKGGAGPIGDIVVTRKEPGKFAPHHIQLIRTLADQAVIAIENARLFNETQRALERQTATSEILKVIAASPSDTAPVFDAIAHSANRLLGGLSTAVWRFEGDIAHLASYTPTSPEADAALRALSPMPVSRLSAFVLLRGGEIAKLTDTEEGPPELRDLARLRGYRSMLFVPLLLGGEAIGFVSVTRKLPGEFDADDLQLLKTFADQAVIAIQNARLFNETKEALEQQEASADVLGAIGRSVSDATPVFEQILDACYRLFGLNEMGIYRVDSDDMVRVAAWRGETRAEVRRDVTPLADSVTGRILRERRTHHIPNLLEDPHISPLVRERAERLGNASLLYAPMLWEDRGLGSILVVRSPPKPFTERETELLKTFADQAAIAIENARLFNETREALERQTATSEVLNAISQSVSDAAPVFETIIDACQRLFTTDQVGIWTVDDKDMVRMAAGRGPLVDVGRHDVSPLAASYTGRAIRNRRIHHIPDQSAEPDLSEKMRERLRKAGSVSLVYAPMLWEDRGLGSVGVLRSPARPFTDKEQSLLQTFASQAAIAIQNAKLFNDTKKALERQTATAEILKVIARSPSDTQPVFEAIVESAKRLLGGLQSNFARFLDGKAHLAAFTPLNPQADAEVVTFFPRPPEDPIFTAQRAGRSILVADTETDEEVSFLREAAQAIGFRSMVTLPVMSQGTAIGGITVTHADVGAITEDDVDLLRTFADQAVIAIENAKLFAEVQAKTRDLEETLAYQIATSDVLSAIGGSMSDAQPVFQRIVDSLARLLEHDVVAIFLAPGDGLVHVAAFSGPNSHALEQVYPRPVEGSAIPVVLERRRQTYFPDVLNGPDVPESLRQSARAVGRNYANVITPMIWEGRGVGVISVVRAPYATYSERELGLLRTFADQAVIAIENARLFNETKEALERQEATGEILSAIGQSVSDTAPVFEKVLDACERLFAAHGIGIFLAGEDGMVRAAAIRGQRASEASSDVTPYADSITAKVIETRTVHHIPNEAALPNLSDLMRDRVRRHGPSSLLYAPMLWKDRGLGSIVVRRAPPRPYSDKEQALLQSFADQAAIAIENARLFNETQARTRELAASLDDLRRTQDRLVQTEKLASLGQLTAGIAHEIKNPLNFINNFSALSGELADELLEVLAPAPLDPKTRDEVDDLTGMIKENLQKVVHHGKRADSIVKNMLLHSRTGASEHRPTDINATLEESLNLAYHGARAEKPGFNITMKRDLDPSAGMADVFPQEISRAFLNLISNGFYAAAKRAEGGGEPELSVATKNLGESVEVRIRDNGTGIPDEIREKIFNPFFTTKPAGEGTGLGLSMTHDIIVKQHGGALDVESSPGSFTEFRIVLPRRGAPIQQGAKH